MTPKFKKELIKRLRNQCYFDEAKFSDDQVLELTKDLVFRSVIEIGMHFDDLGRHVTKVLKPIVEKMNNLFTKN